MQPWLSSPSSAKKSEILFLASLLHYLFVNLSVSKMNNNAGKSQDISLTIIDMTVVKADPELVVEHREPLSNLDLFLYEQDIDVILCYEKPEIGFDSMVAVLIKSLAETLVEYYVFAGELVCKENGSFGELEILCNNCGVEFTTARVDLELNKLQLHKPDKIMGGKLAPARKVGNFSVQVTEFMTCGSIVVVCRFDHKVADAYSTNMFLVSWSENACSKPLSFHPSRLILNPRSPLHHAPEMEKLLSPISSLPPPFFPSEQDSNISRMYYVEADQIIALQAAASTETSKCTKFESFSAFLWQMLVKRPSQEDNKVELVTKLFLAVDGRTRLTSVYDSESCINYFGNLVSGAIASENVETISQKPLAWVAERVAQAIEVVANKDYFLDLIDMIETLRPELGIPTNLWPRSTDGPKVMVSSGLRFPLIKIDFGWGRPLVGFYHLNWDHTVDLQYVMPVTTENGDWLVYAHLPSKQIEFIENMAPHIFKPLTFDLVTSAVSSSVTK